MREIVYAVHFSSDKIINSLAEKLDVSNIEKEREREKNEKWSLHELFSFDVHFRRVILLRLLLIIGIISPSNDGGTFEPGRSILLLF